VTDGVTHQIAECSHLQFFHDLAAALRRLLSCEDSGTYSNFLGYARESCY
jgi:hypothetical protein